MVSIFWFYLNALKKYFVVLFMAYKNVNANCERIA